MSAVIVYIDGFNLYFGIDDHQKAHLHCYKWLNLQCLAEALVQDNPLHASDDQLVAVKYFTASIRGSDQKSSEKHRRQYVYWKALETLDKLERIEGGYQLQFKQCHNCGYKVPYPEEKQSDSKICASMLLDAMDDSFGKAILISSDSDHIPPIKAIKTRWPHKRIVVYSPPKRHHQVALKRAAHAEGRIKISMLENCQFPLQVTQRDHPPIDCPDEWRA